MHPGMMGGPPQGPYGYGGGGQMPMQMQLGPMPGPMGALNSAAPGQLPPPAQLTPGPPMDGIPDRVDTAMSRVERHGYDTREFRPAGMAIPEGTPGYVGINGAAMNPLPGPMPPGIAYLQDQVRKYENAPGGFSPENLTWINQWYGGELFERRVPPAHMTPPAPEEMEKTWNSGWVQLVARPQGIEWNPSQPPTLAMGTNSQNQNYYIPWVNEDPSSKYPDGMKPSLQWFPQQQMPYEAQPVVVGQGEEQFTETKFLLRKVTWYVPDGVELGLPRLPVKVFGIPPKDDPGVEKPKPHYPTVKFDAAVDVGGLEKDPQQIQMREQWLSQERRDMKEEYKRQAKLTEDRGRGCAEALI